MSRPEIVHVRTHAVGGRPFCATGIVLGRGEGGNLLVRVLSETPRGQAIGTYDAEAWYPDHPVTFPGPDGTEREADYWHGNDACPLT